MTQEISDEGWPMWRPAGSDAEMLAELRRVNFKYFLDQWNDRTGLIADKTEAASPASIAAVGLGLSAYVVGVERNLISRTEAVQRTLKVLRFFHASPQGKEPDATGYKGFYYHFIHMETGRRAWQCELSTIDTAILMAGILTAATYFDRGDAGETEVRKLADSLYRRVDWNWALNGKATMTHGWNPSPASFPTGGTKGTAKPIFCTSWLWAPQLFRSGRTVIANGRRRLNGRNSMAGRTSMPGRFSSINSPRYGWTVVGSRMR